ncbi:MAG TPA: response regulator [Acidimicrobiia bacterium]|nr:response regulator [Acidimicrobiia bacterium]
MTVAAYASSRNLAFEGVDEPLRVRTLNQAVDDARILVVDDDPHAARYMLQLLERHGFSRVTSVDGGREALRTIVAEAPDVLVLDAHMPQVDGFGVLREMQHNSVSVLTAVLGVSGDSSVTTGQAMLSAGADDFIGRPFEGRKFALRVRRLALVTRELRRTLEYRGWLDARSDFSSLS